MLLTSDQAVYQVERKIASNSQISMYLCTRDQENYILQIATDTDKNAKLDSAAYFLNELKKVSEKYEEVYSKKHPDEEPLNYDWLFPQVVDNFVSKEQKERRVLVLAMNGAPDVLKLVPLARAVPSGARVDQATSIWIIGRLLKLLVLAHDQCISLRVGLSDVLIEPDLHRVVVINWLKAKSYQDDIPEAEMAVDIKCVADIAMRILDEDSILDSNEYIDFLAKLAEEPSSDIEQVYQEFEQAHGKLFDSETFYPFTVER